MKIHGLMIIKNEADVIRFNLEESRKWCDTIYVFDNGSSDRTWDIVNERAACDPGVIPFRSAGIPFQNSLRGDIFRAFRTRAAAGDWWCRLDADEFYIDEPREFLSLVPRSDHVVWALHFQYYLTKEDCASFPAPMARPPEITPANAPRHFLVNASEPRFFRHRAGLTWKAHSSWPSHMGVVHARRIRLRHFQFRSPAQIQLRLDTRHLAVEQGCLSFAHNLETEWTECLVRSQDVNYEETAHSLEDAAIARGTPSHLESKQRRFLKRVLHGLGIWP